MTTGLNLKHLVPRHLFFVLIWFFTLPEEEADVSIFPGIRSVHRVWGLDPELYSEEVLASFPWMISRSITPIGLVIERSRSPRQVMMADAERLNSHGEFTVPLHCSCFPRNSL